METGEIPDHNTIVRGTDFSNALVEGALKNKELLESLSDIGVPANGSGTFLAAEQLYVLNAVFDLNDGRSFKKKLGDAGVSTAQYQKWLKDPKVQNYLRARTDSLFGDNMHEAYIAVLDNVRRGDTAAIKLMLEMSGRYSPKTGSEINVEFLMMKILEVLTMRLAKDHPQLLRVIAEDLGALAPGNSPPVGFREHLPHSEPRILELESLNVH